VYNIDRSEYWADFEVTKVKNMMDYDYDPTETYFPVTCIRWYSGAHILTSSGDGKIKLYNVNEVDSSKKIKHTIDFAGSGINAIDVDPDKKYFVSGGMDHSLRVFDYNTMKEKIVYCREPLKPREHSNRIFSVLVDPSNSNIIYSGGWDKSIMVHDVRKGSSVATFLGPYVSGDTLDISGEVLLAGSYRSYDPMELFDIRTGDCLTTYQWEKDVDKKGGQIVACQYGHPKFNTILSASSLSHELKLYNRKDGATLASVKGFSSSMTCIHLDYEGKTCAIGTKKGKTILLSYGKKPEEDE